LLEAAAAEDVAAEVVDGCRCAARLEDGRIAIVVDGRGLELPDVVIPRIGNWRPESLLAVLEALIDLGAASANDPVAIRCGRDHWRSLRILVEHGVPVPTTCAGADPEQLAAVARRHLDGPFVVKQRRSRMGVGVIQCRDHDHLEAVLDSLWRLGDEFIVQQWIPGGETSYRLLVAGGRVVTACRFRAVDGDWRSNAARGGTASAWRPSSRAVELAVRAADALGLGQCGVDLVHAENGPMVLEVNPTPGFRRLEAATGADVARALVAHAVSLAGSG
jgi:RimK family alpha-L-glutamate ligase